MRRRSADRLEPRPSFATAPRMRQPSCGTPTMRDTARVCPVVSTAVAKKHTTTVITAIRPGQASRRREGLRHAHPVGARHGAEIDQAERRRHEVADHHGDEERQRAHEAGGSA